MKTLSIFCDHLAKIAVEDLGSDGKVVPIEICGLIETLSEDTGFSIDAITLDLRQRILMTYLAKEGNSSGPTRNIQNTQELR